MQKCRGGSDARWTSAYAFVDRILEGEKMAGVCREFGISRKTGCKIISRYREPGLKAMTGKDHLTWGRARAR